MKLTIFKSFILANFLIILTLFCSCNDVQFDSPQPVWVTKNEKEIPSNFRGNYICGKDTIQITENRIMDNKINHDIDFTLSDSVLLRIYNHFYFLNLSNGRQKTWSVIMGKEEKQKILYYMLSFEDSIMLNRLKKITKVKETKDSTGKVTNCVINPTSEEFRKILKGNLFTITDTLTKIK